jgi:chemotaxis protein methyltransferase CheR
MPAIESIGISQLAQLATRIEAEAGLSFSGGKLRTLQSALKDMTLSLGLENETEAVQWLLAGAWSKPKTELCAAYLTVGETYFFREPRAFDLVRDYAEKKFGDAAVPDKKLRIWSAGCCTGEEPYSIAMSLAEQFPEMEMSRFSILATDICPSYLAVARTGKYRQWSMRKTSDAMMRRYFTETNEGEFRIAEPIKSMVTFAELNLAAKSYSPVVDTFQDMDMIFCRNVMMYFSKEQARSVIARLRHCLADGGWLIVSPAEASSDLYEGFTAFYYPDAVYFQKADTAARMPERMFERMPEPARLIQSEQKDPSTILIRFTSRVPETKAAGLRKKMSGNRPRTETTVTAAPVVHDLLPETDFHNAALTAIEAGDTETAIKALKAELYLRPDSAIANYWLGAIRLNQQRYEAAIRHLRIAGRLFSDIRDDAVVLGAEPFSAAYMRSMAAALLKKAEDALV